MGFFGTLFNGAAKKVMVDEAFRRGQAGEPPLMLVSEDPAKQAVLDRAYEQGQKSVLNRVASKFLGSNRD